MIYVPAYLCHMVMTAMTAVKRKAALRLQLSCYLRVLSVPDTSRASAAGNSDDDNDDDDDKT